MASPAPVHLHEHRRQLANHVERADGATAERQLRQAASRGVFRFEDQAPRLVAHHAADDRERLMLRRLQLIRAFAQGRFRTPASRRTRV